MTLAKRKIYIHIIRCSEFSQRLRYNYQFSFCETPPLPSCQSQSRSQTVEHTVCSKVVDGGCGGSKAENAKAEANSREATGPRGINNDERAKGRSWSVPRPYTSRCPIMLMNINAPLGVAAINAGHSGARIPEFCWKRSRTRAALPVQQRK